MDDCLPLIKRIGHNTWYMKSASELRSAHFLHIIDRINKMITRIFLYDYDEISFIFLN